MENTTKTIKLLVMRNSYTNKQIIDLIASYGNLDATYENLLRKQSIKEIHLKKSQETIDFCRFNGSEKPGIHSSKNPDWF